MSTSYEHQLNTLMGRFGFQHTKREIKKVFPTTAISKDSFREEVAREALSSPELKESIEELGVLASKMGTRQVELFKIHMDDHDSLDSVFDNVTLVSSGDVYDAFPFPIEEQNKLRKLSKGVVLPMLKSDITLGDYQFKTLILCAVAEKEVEETLGANHLNEAGLEFTRDQEGELIFKRKQNTQLFHTVYWSKEAELLIISVDRHSLSLTSSQDQLFLLRGYLTNNGAHPGDALNVFNAIEPLYNESDGYVVKLGHVTTQSNPVRIQLKGSEKCLKQDRYHSTGENQGFVDAKFAVAKRWFFRGESEVKIPVEVELSGKAAMIYSAQPLTDFAVNKCMRLQDLDFAIKNVLPHAS
ncbi:hypothetical protein [Vibrio parahaemolyticus]|uniref:hypothetical protein n=3 Tax=Vibrio parahaemolyticus TaxID=670 RepID=UPI001122C3F6|nr:hypothetical protein [Vibrio parahaemolyticus]HEQ3587667.1 hypothetical protein [Vibrio harveyi]ELA9310782.1 hypothetical protein [Vibrio parahaemolyticus]MBE3841526.1 hypothetical protein [Vibrio parahaemolyticus]MBE3944057.1 hypothetical protein [Vibrio parahaemolyticus]MBE4112534.1 hypothetical protein [Vibrio parahaemolyticus]